MGIVVGFDLDMTLVDSRPGIRASMDALAQESGVPIDVAVVLSRLGPKLEWELAQWFPADRVADAAARYRALYWDRCVGAGTILLAGARASVDAVHGQGGTVVVVTAKTQPLAVRCIDAVGLDVDAVVGHVYADEKTTALRGHGAGVYVGDTETDVRSGHAAGATAIGCDDRTRFA